MAAWSICAPQAGRRGAEGFASAACSGAALSRRASRWAASSLPARDARSPPYNGAKECLDCYVRGKRIYDVLTRLETRRLGRG